MPESTVARREARIVGFVPCAPFPTHDGDILEGVVRYPSKRLPAEEYAIELTAQGDLCVRHTSGFAVTMPRGMFFLMQREHE